MRTHHAALARTTLLLNRELFAGEADERAIADALLATRVRLVADEESLASRAGQTALVTAFVLTARLGVGIELAVPNLPVIDLVAPLRLPALRDSLMELGRDLVPGAIVRSRSGAVDETFVFGAGAHGARTPVRVIATDLAADLERSSVETQCAGDLPFGGFAAGAAVAAIALEVALPHIEAATSLSARRPRPSPGPPVRIRLQELFPKLAGGPALELSDIDAISGGAITHALLFCLLRIPGLHTRARVIEQQRAELSNVNRYALLRASDEGSLKTDQLERVAAAGVEIVGVPSLFTKDTRDALLPFAERVMVGVDDVEARWWVQQEDPAWLAVGATGNHLAQLTTHVPGSPCAACIHAVPLSPQTIPTISFVSFWAGLLQACALVSGSRLSRNVIIHPFALGGPSAVMSFSPVANPSCPIGCSASHRKSLPPAWGPARHT
jgi:molybdopterin/thiamine biosynthesis adenylyltransferase